MKVLPLIVVIIGTSCLLVNITTACTIKTCADCRACANPPPGCIHCLIGIATKRSSPDFLPKTHPQDIFLSEYTDMEDGDHRQTPEAVEQLIASALRKMQNEDNI